MENTERQMVVVRQPGETRMLATITKETFLREFSVPAVQVACRAVNSYSAVFSANTPALIEIEQAYGYDCLRAYLEGWLVTLREFVNVGKKMTDAQTCETAMIIFIYHFFYAMGAVLCILPITDSSYSRIMAGV